MNTNSVLGGFSVSVLEKIVILSIGGIVSIEGKWDCLVEGVMFSIGEKLYFLTEIMIDIGEYQSFMGLSVTDLKMR